MAMKNLKYIVSAIILISIAFNYNSQKAESASEYLVSLANRNWKENTKIFHQPNGPFALILFDDQYPVAGIIYYDIMGNPTEGAWKINERFWQEKEWASDISSFLWHPDGKYLYITTDNVYGTASLFKLDLMKKNYTKLISDEELVEKSPSKYPTSIYMTDFNLRTSEVILSIEYYIGNVSTPQKVKKKTLKLD